MGTNEVFLELAEPISVVANLVPYLKESSTQIVGTSMFAAGVLTLNYDGIARDWTARIEVMIPKEWWKNPPIVKCFEPWVRRDIDWHIYQSGELCWVYGPQWTSWLKDYDAIAGLPPRSRFATDWMLRNVRHLLSCHRAALDLQILEWPSQWQQYAHGSDARLKFQHDERRRKQKQGRVGSRIFVG